VPYKDAEAGRAYYREWRRSAGKRLSDKYYSAARHANQRAQRFGCTGLLTTADVRRVLDGKVCTYCGGTDRICVDHREPLARGGDNTPENIVPSCRSCNARKYLADQPGRWAALHWGCVECGLTEKPNAGKGLCQRCYNRKAGASRKPRGKRK